MRLIKYFPDPSGEKLSPGDLVEFITYVRKVRDPNIHVVGVVHKIDADGSAHILMENDRE